MIFTPKYDESLRNGCRAGKVPTDLLSMDTALAALFAEVKTKLSQDILDSRPDQGSEESAPAPAPAESSSPSCSEALTQFMETVRARCGENTNQETLELMQSCEAKARSLFNSNVSLHVCPGSERELLELLKSSKVAQIRGDKQAWVGIFVDNCQWGEPITNPHVRTAPLNLSYLKTFVNAVIASRDPQCLTLHTRDLYMFFDGFQHHQLTKMLGAVQSATGSSLTKNSFQVNLSYDEESLRKRRAYVKVQSTVFDQIEQMALVTSEPFQESMSYRARAHFKGTSVGNKIGDIHVDAPGTLWSLTMKDCSFCKPFFPRHKKLNTRPLWISLLFSPRRKSSTCMASTGSQLEAARLAVTLLKTTVAKSTKAKLRWTQCSGMRALSFSTRSF